MMTTQPHPQRQSRRLRGSDAGATLTELVIGMSMLGVVMAGVFGVVHGLAKDYTKTNSIEASSAATANVFLRMEKQARYARRINPPGTVVNGSSTDAYVEMLVDTPGTDTCYQWRLDGAADQLEVRSWLQNAAPPATWNTVGRGMANDPTIAGQAPFVFTNNGGSNTFQQLDLHLLVRSAPNQPTIERQASFIARNSNVTGLPSVVCTDSSGKVARP